MAAPPQPQCAHRSCLPFGGPVGSLSHVDLALAAEGGPAPGAASVRSVRGRPAGTGGSPGPAWARPLQSLPLRPRHRMQEVPGFGFVLRVLNRLPFLKGRNDQGSSRSAAQVSGRSTPHPSCLYGGHSGCAYGARGPVAGWPSTAAPATAPEGTRHADRWHQLGQGPAAPSWKSPRPGATLGHGGWSLPPCLSARLTTPGRGATGQGPRPPRHPLAWSTPSLLASRGLAVLQPTGSWLNQGTSCREEDSSGPSRGTLAPDLT
ncbi:uncharacterized protein LOC121021429 isoform X2 [Herpailurus yagouaroundi]|uniref:uncharacterized protein LOC121021429 isoform X2 n=1 Tax=Herpailurus yagouaroundi TaxID=1608482 RepID=UPI001AD7DBD6|nr:uncharacterized protein LOC121021429 isoform X2 [Puma yagouaroundi]